MKRSVVQSVLIVFLVVIAVVTKSYVSLSPESVLGDINHDKKVDIQDAIFILQVLYQEKSMEGDADFNKDGVVDFVDVEDLLTFIYSSKGVNEKVAFSPSSIPHECDGVFIRGDANEDRSLDLADVVFLLDLLFVPGSSLPSCEDILDSNGDELVSVSDAVYLLAYLSSGGDAPVDTYSETYFPLSIVSPGLDESCDYVDNDGDGTVDEGCSFDIECMQTDVETFIHEIPDVEGPGDTVDRINVISQTPDCGYLIGGAWGGHPVFKKFDYQLNEVWSYQGTSSFDPSASFLFGRDFFWTGEGYVIIYPTVSEVSNLVFLDPFGEHVWAHFFKSFLLGYSHLINTLAPTDDGNFVIGLAGYDVTLLTDPTSPTISPGIAKFSESGDFVWNTGMLDIRDVSFLPGEGFIGAGRQVIASQSLASVAKFTLDGQEDWVVNLPSLLSFTFEDVVEASDGGFVASGINELTEEVEIIKITSSGTIDWIQSYSFDTTNFVHDLISTSDGGYLIVGESCSGSIIYCDDADPTDKAFALKVDSLGIQEWVRTYETFNLLEARSVDETSDGGFVIGGLRENSGDYNMFFIKTDSEGFVL